MCKNIHMHQYLKQNALSKVSTSKIPRTKNFTFVNYSKQYLGSLVDPQQACPRDLEWPLSSAFEVQKKLQYKNHAGWLKCKILASSLTCKMSKKKHSKVVHLRVVISPLFPPLYTFSIYFIRMKKFLTSRMFNFSL